jgi:wyosine [tRNA(Phe)-imidazoG37] synthetase (radical SAM superfamily)
LREKTEKELDKARNEANKKARADYDARKTNAFNEIEKLIDNITPDIIEVLRKYGMDTSYATDKTAEENGFYNSIVRIVDREIQNNEEFKKLREAENARYKKQQQLIEDFAIECELGVDKTEFFDALANLCKKFSE